MSLALPQLCLGGNVFGWTADEAGSFAVLDAARDAGIHFIDSADVYSAWAHGGTGGQSEEIIGRWVRDRGAREETIIATKGGMHPGTDNLRPANLRGTLTASLGRLGIDVIDLYYAHQDDGGDLTETVAVFDAFIREGLIRAYGLSNFDADRLAQVYAVADREGFARPAALQPGYSLVDRGFEDDLQPFAVEHDLAVVPYFALAKGFLTGKYRPGGEHGDSPRAGAAAAYLDEPRGPAVLAALDAVAADHDVPVAAVALAWLRAQPSVVAPIASARTVEQVEPLAASLDLELSAGELEALTSASATA